jgi:NAD(P)-dependent dehydrogenase (short-subunit alcohol dehydrogenase family)
MRVNHGRKLKKLSDQVVVITGASSGIGLATARLAAERGARVVMAARSQRGLVEGAEGIRREGGRVTHVVADVSDSTGVEAIAEHALLLFGHIDTWINNAAVTVYGRIEDVDVADMRRVFDVTFWGTVYGCRAAIPHLRESGGAIINVGSMESEVALPLNGAYAAAKHAVRAFTDVLRMELEKEGANISVSLVKPAGIDTPFFEHAKNYLSGDPQPPPPVYSPEVVARTILTCAERPVRDIVVGGSGRLQVSMRRLAPRLSDKLLNSFSYRAQEREPRPNRHREGALYVPRGTHGKEQGDYHGHVMRSSAYTYAALHPAKTMVVMLSLGAMAFGLARWMRPA